MNKNPQYDTDFYAWALYNARLLRQGKLKEIDVEHIAEEMESMGSREKRELISRLSMLMAHLLKWQFQFNRRSNSWKYTIKEQRSQIEDLLDESPSLKFELSEKLERAYHKAVLHAVAETGITENQFAEKCPYTLQQCLDEEYYPT